MAFFDNLTKKISDVGQSTIQKVADVSQSTIQKGKELAEIAKYNSMIAEEERLLTAIYTQIGKQYVEQHAEDADEDLEQSIAEIRLANEKIEEYKRKLTELKGRTTCPSCGSEVSTNAAYCAVCGAKLPVIEAEATVVETEEEDAVEVEGDVAADNTDSTEE